MDGSFLINRQIFDSWVFADDKALKIWIWLLGKARYKKGAVPMQVGRGQTAVTLDRGQLIFGRHKAEEALGYDGSLIYRKVQKMQEMGMINTESNSHYTVITICNYDSYQLLKTPERTSNEQAMNSKRTANEQQTNTNKKDNKDNKERGRTSVFDFRVELKKVLKTFKHEKLKASPRDVFEKEILKFIAHWTETDKTGKARHEIEKFFSMEKRLTSWCDKIRIEVPANYRPKAPAVGRMVRPYQGD